VQSTNELLKGEFNLLEVKAYRESGQDEQAKKLLNDLISRWQKLDSVILLAKVYYQQGDLFKSQGEFKQSLVPF